MTRRSKPYEEGLHKRLRDPDYAARYLGAMLEDSDEGFLLALRDVAEAGQGLGKLAETAKVNRENLYRMLSEHGNPRLSSLAAVLQALGLRLSVTALIAEEQDSEDNPSLGLSSSVCGALLGSVGAGIGREESLCGNAPNEPASLWTYHHLPARKPPTLEQKVYPGDSASGRGFVTGSL
jgi:probable addiction module antidote protein